MNEGLSNKDAADLGNLLTKLVNGLYGAIDFWTTVCIGQIPPDPRAFVLKQSNRLVSLLEQIRLIFEKDRPAASPSDLELLGKLDIACSRLRDAFLTLAEFRTKSIEEVRLATETLKTAYEEFRQFARELGESNGIALSVVRELNPVQEQYHRRILESLFTQFCNYRSTAPRTVSVSSSSL